MSLAEVICFVFPTLFRFVFNSQRIIKNKYQTIKNSPTKKNTNYFNYNLNELSQTIKTKGKKEKY